jgi:plasmid stabilization system protein ParE
MGTYLITPAAMVDVQEIVNRIFEENVEAAIRVQDAISREYQLLADMPGVGPRCELDEPDLANLRF